MIVERELEIEAFKAREYWSIEASVSKQQQPFLSRLVTYMIISWFGYRAVFLVTACVAITSAMVLFSGARSTKA
jgi:DNA topoisomerase IA